ncbi:cation:proton antiporter domain-containing protein [Rhodopila globiformis]|uniref:Potassium transporter TrkA n=1 Tax=Rhodopila globiformis TaxID=1071 RepID=A0A2S6N119_RHOGL|nr:cation:proton antiporter [Rhodopila globiformis]PPQ28286.1 potassium transporter TrkA [Rhodopila globiformis]
MAVSHDTTVYQEALVVLGAAGVVIPLFHRLRLSPVLGFMLVGAVVGPFGLASLAPGLPWLAAITISNPDSMQPIAELGVALLLFMIGLELSFERLWLMRRLVFGLGFLQVALCASLLTAIEIELGQDWTAALVIGLALAMSSTAVVVQVLSEEKRLNSPTGRTSFAILLFQDLAVVPVLFAVGALDPANRGSGSAELGIALGRAAVAVAVIVALGRLVLRPLFRSVARTRSAELFVAACLLVVLATGLVTSAVGLSMPLGALIGGLLLAVTEYRRQVEVTIEPFKGLFLGVFLISVGMSLDVRTVAAHPALVFDGIVGVVALKLLVIAPLSRAFGLTWGTSLQTGLLLGPGGEFGFVIIAVALNAHLLTPDIASPVLFITALTMATIPGLSMLGNRLAPRLAPKAEVDSALLLPDTPSLPRVIIAGFGRVGQTVAAMLEMHKVPYVAIDSNVDRVSAQRRQGKPVYFGDMTQIELLRRVHLDTARALVVTLDASEPADRLVAAARAERGDLLIVARARDAAHAAHLYRTGASDAVPETIEASLQLSEAVLVDVGVPMGPVIATIHEKRAELQAAIKAMAPGAEVRPLGRKRLRDRL